MKLLDKNALKPVAEVSLFERKQALRNVYRIAKIWDIYHAIHMLDTLLFTSIISVEAYSSLICILKKQSEQEWY